MDFFEVAQSTTRWSTWVRPDTSNGRVDWLISLNSMRPDAGQSNNQARAAEQAQ